MPWNAAPVPSGLIHHTGTERPFKCSGRSSGQEAPPSWGAELPALRGDELNSSVKSVLKARRRGPSKGDLVCGVEGAGQPQSHLRREVGQLPVRTSWGRGQERNGEVEEALPEAILDLGFSSE